MSRSFEVRIAPHERVIHAHADQPVLDAALAAGLNLPHSCKSGHCASCRARLLSGEIEYPRGRPLGLTAEDVRAGYVLLCQARARSALRIEARLIARVGDVEIKTLPSRIARKVQLAPDVLQLFLRLPAVERLEFQPGQYLDVLLEDGRRRSFSIASPPHDSALLELHVRRVAGGGFTQRLFDELAVGALLRIEGPLGQFIYRDSSAPLLLIAGGTGFAPLKSMLRHALERAPSSSLDRRMHLFWGVRAPADLYEAALVREWVKRHPQLSFTPVFSQTGRGGAGPDSSPGVYREGLVHEAVLADYPCLAQFEVCAAGPPEMIEAIRAAYPAHGLAPEHLSFDSFDYASDSRAERTPHGRN
ncbi:MAG TPA: FAD-binding oxidoreductase [Steroidobacteraceae bacterium]